MGTVTTSRGSRPSHRIPDDWWGLGMGRVKQIVKSYGPDAWVTNLVQEYDIPHDRFRIKDVGRDRIVAKSQRHLDRVLGAIRDAVQAEELEQDEVDRITVKAMRLWRAQARLDREKRQQKRAETRRQRARERKAKNQERLDLPG